MDWKNPNGFHFSKLSHEWTPQFQRLASLLVSTYSSNDGLCHPRITSTASLHDTAEKLKINIT
ncbi:hypothetical protein T4A_7761 [Trichinella pseudospiralis]|uniref:Uncharacterized protein n=1 Tax=Trichinella pseudospiralis TaxID=6337 RepID=A0A0V1DLS5_TRIPS|nr:hypothetical protein T4A_7761 [Trichinella pseudospiralis]